MSLSDLKLNKHYLSPRDDVVRDFFIPVLSNSTAYDRASGFFSSYALVETVVGVCELVKKGGKIRIITSPRLNMDDVKAIHDGYDRRSVIEDAAIRDFEDPSENEAKDRLSLLTYLIKTGALELKIAVMNNLEDYPNSMFHAKIGIMKDEKDILAFTGSMNETRNGLGGNWDHVTVENNNFNSRCDAEDLADIFEMLWQDKDPTASVFDAPEIIDFLMSKYVPDPNGLNLDDQIMSKFGKKESVFFRTPDSIKVRDYQRKAIENWMDSGSCGIFSMATGTGKTITALSALESLYNEKNGGIFTIIICPQIHLVDQWAENVRNYGVEPIIGYSDPKLGDWKTRFRRSVLNQKRANEKANYCLITTINSFSSDEIQKFIADIRELAIVVDEAHNMGSSLGLTKLPSNARYRLGLSATVERFRDVAGTARLREDFGEESINYPLEKAIGKDLTNYKYYPIPCVMDDEEYAQFIDINEQINGIVNDNAIKESKKEMMLRPLRLNGAMLVSRMHSKLDSLVDVSKQYLDDTHILVYCGKSRWIDDVIDEENQNECEKTITKVVRTLGHNGLGMKLSKFTYLESATERRSILSEFERGRTSVLVAISCLDEGVDIPSIKTAILMSSSDNPKEYIQRRGRVLRKYPGKDFAVIYDMIALPRSLGFDNSGKPTSELEMKFIVKEMLRAEEFSRLSLNDEETKALINSIEKSYGMSAEEMIRRYKEDVTDGS